MSCEFPSYSDFFTRELAWKVPSRNADAETVFSQVLYELWFSLFQTLRIGLAVVMSYKWRIYFPVWTDVIGSPNPSIIIKSIESHTKKTHLTAYNHRTSPSCFHEMVWIVSPLSYETPFIFTCKFIKKKRKKENTSIYLRVRDSKGAADYSISSLHLWKRQFLSDHKEKYFLSQPPLEKTSVSADLSKRSLI